MQNDNNTWNHNELYISDLDKYMPPYTQLNIQTIECNIVYQGELLKVYPLLRKSRLASTIILSSP